MKSLAFFCFNLMIGLLPLAYGQSSKPKVSIKINDQEVKEQAFGFLVNGQSNKRVLAFKPEVEGMFTAKIEWEGSAQKLSLTLNGPGQVEYYVRRNGSSPLYLQFKFTKEQVTTGGDWKLSIVNFETDKTASGGISLYWPLKSQLSAPPSKDTIGMLYGTFLALDRSTWGKGSKRFLPDGTYQITYPTGYYIKKTPKGKLIFYHAGERKIYDVYKISPVIAVPKADPPASTLAGASSEWAIQMNKWIDDINNNTLWNEIKMLLDNNQEMITKFTEQEKEKTKTRYQRLVFRIKSIDELRDINEGN